MSSITISIISCICGLLATTSPAQAQGWRGIVPLHSTREDVERLIGSPMVPNGITYDLKSERVNVVYSDGGCAKGHPSEWNVPPGTVTSIRIYPQTKLLLSDLRIDLNGFEKFIPPHTPDFVSYSSEEKGIGIVTKSNGEVVTIHYFPAATDRHLRCPNSSEQQPTLEARKFDEYSNIPFSDEKARLDNLAAYLQQEPTLIGYIIAYAGRQTRSGEAKARADRAKNHLVNERGIEARRVVTIDGGYREKPMVELYLLPRGASAPAATPTVEPSEVQIIKVAGTRKYRRSTPPRCKR